MNLSLSMIDGRGSGGNENALPARQLSQAAIGKVLGGLDYTTVSRERKRLREMAQEDKRVGATLREIEDRLRHR